MQAIDPRSLVGAWQLERWSMSRSDGSVTEPLGRGARGLLVFTSDGWATITIAAADRPRPARRGGRPRSAARRGAPFDDFVAYCCRWRVAGRSVELDVLLSQNAAMEGSVQVRRVRMRGRVLEFLSTVAAGGATHEHRLRWRPATAAGIAPPAASKSRQPGKRP